MKTASSVDSFGSKKRKGLGIGRKIGFLVSCLLLLCLVICLSVHMMRLGWRRGRGGVGGSVGHVFFSLLVGGGGYQHIIAKLFQRASFLCMWEVTNGMLLLLVTLSRFIITNNKPIEMR